MAYSTKGKLETTVNDDKVVTTFKKLSRPQFVTLAPFMSQKEGSNEIEFLMQVDTGMSVMDEILQSNILSIHTLIVDDTPWTYTQGTDPLEKLELLQDVNYTPFMLELFQAVVTQSMVSPEDQKEVKKPSSESGLVHEEPPGGTSAAK